MYLSMQNLDIRQGVDLRPDGFREINRKRKHQRRFKIRLLVPHRGAEVVTADEASRPHFQIDAGDAGPFYPPC
jgi:hypothetical protein